MVGATVTPPLAFLSRKRTSSTAGPGSFLSSNQSTSLFTTGSSTLHLSNCSVTVLSLEPNTLPSRTNAAGGNGGNNNVTIAASAAAAAGASRSLAAGAGANRNGATSLDVLMGEAIQTIGACLVRE